MNLLSCLLAWQVNRIEGLHPTGHSVTNVMVRKTLTETARAISTPYIKSCKCRSNHTNSQFRRIIIIIIYSLYAGLLARSQYPEGPVTGHFGTGFSWFSCV